MSDLDAIVIGSGPNGLAAAIVIAETGRKVVVFEAEPTIGGGARSGELTLPGFVHDLCSAIHPFAVASPFFRGVPLARYGLEWIEPPAMLAHPFDDGPPAMIYRSVERTAEGLGPDARAYRRLVGDSAFARCNRPSGRRARFTPSAPARSSPGLRRTACCRSIGGRARRSGWCSGR